MNCTFCKRDVKELDVTHQAHLTIALSKSGKDDKVHVHGDIENTKAMEKLLDIAIVETGLSGKFNKASHNCKLDHVKEIVFHNKQRIGDMLMYTCAIRDFKKAFPHIRVGVISSAMHIWDNNPYVDLTMNTNEFMTKANLINKDAKVVEIEPGRFFAKIGPGRGTNQSNRVDWHFANSYRMSIEDLFGVKIEQGESRPDIWLTEEEFLAPRIDMRPYWIIITGGEKGWGCKMYPTVRWQEVVDQNPDILFYQLGCKSDNHVRLTGPNVVDYIGKTEDPKTGIRDLFKLFLNAEGSMGLVSFHMHLSGALYKPSVVIAGAREPVHFTRFPGHQYIANDGCLPCATSACWHCDIAACTNLVDYSGKQVTLPKKDNDKGKQVPYVPKELNDKIMPKCVDMISSEEVTRYLRRYYDGGRLVKGVISPKPKQFKNVVKSGYPKTTVGVPVPMTVIEEVKKMDQQIIEATKHDDCAETSPIYNSYGLKFNGGALTIRDWEFILLVIKKYGIKTVLEFGAGLSTLLFSDIKLDKFISYEAHTGWIDRLKKLKSDVDIRYWDGKEVKEVLGEFDLCFVDGPAGDFNRDCSTQIAANVAKLVMVHDAGREWARKYQEQYLAPNYHGPIKGGHRCHLWVRKDIPRLAGTVVEGDVITASTIAKEMKARCDEDKQQLNKILQPSNTAKSVQTIKFVSTARGWGGCARSITTIMEHLLKEGHKVEFIPFRNAVTSKEFQQCIKEKLAPLGLVVTNNFDTIKDKCDVLVMYADDYIWEFKTPKMVEVFSNIGATKKIMVLNYRRGDVGTTDWTKDWDKYMFLNSSQEKELLKLIPQAKTKVLAPCTELADFLLYKPNFEQMVRIVRHNSQGDTKFVSEKYGPLDVIDLMDKALQCRSDIAIDMMPGPSFMPARRNFNKAQKTDKTKLIAEFLSKGNLFWYSLPPGYMDMGPRVILEAMAVGLPILADNWGGAPDRVTKECGWICKTKEEQIQIIQNVTLSELKKKGEASRQRALDEFIPSRWIKEIVS